MTSHPELDTVKLVGISGKPGSVKMRYAFPIIQELRFHGYNVIQSSLASALYSELNSLIDDWHASERTGADALELSNKNDIDHPLFSDLLDLIQPGTLGEKHEYGYSRRNENMRKALTMLGSRIRRETDVHYFMNKMIDSLSTDVDFAVFTDLRYPDEADYINENDGFSIRIAEPPKEVYADASDGFKYSKEGLNDPTETALDDYVEWYERVQPWTFTGSKFVLEMLDYVGLPSRSEQVHTPRQFQSQL